MQFFVFVLHPECNIDLVRQTTNVILLRASCATDRCLLFTNIDPIPSHQIDMIPAFDKTKYSNPNDWDRVLDEHLILPKSTDWTQEGYHNAVDQRNDTCWSMKSSKRQVGYQK